MFEFIPGATEKSIEIKLRDSTTGQGKTGLVFNSTGVTCGYHRLPNGTPAAIVPVTLAAITSAWASGGFKEVDATNKKGVYRFDLPNAVIAAGVAYATVSFGFTGVLDTTVLIRLNTPTALSGSGSVAETITITTSGAVPIAGASVWVTSDLAGATIVAGTLSTDVNGQATFYLDPGNYFVWVTAADYNGTNPTTITVS